MKATKHYIIYCMVPAQPSASCENRYNKSTSDTVGKTSLLRHLSLVRTGWGYSPR